MLGAMRWAVLGLLTGVGLTSCLELSSAEDPGTGGQTGSGGGNVGGASGWPSGGSSADADTDADDGDSDAGDASTLGTSCTTDTQCGTGFCAALSALVGSSAGSVCSRGCCSSADCQEPGAVCFPTEGGFGACVPVQLVGRPSPGSGASGAACSNDSACRSAACIDGKCQDTCCSDSDCTGGTKCTLATLAGASRTAFLCAAAPGGAGAFQSCSAQADCTSGLCAGKGYCVPTCCSSATCTGQAKTCGYGTLGLKGDTIRICAESTPGTKSLGATCSAGTECAGGYCLSSTKICSAACCTDSDCGDPQAFACRPQTLASGTVVLLCLPR
jgi:hypothetical protein